MSTQEKVALNRSGTHEEGIYINCKIRGSAVPLLVDTGASTSILSMKTYEDLQKKQDDCMFKKCLLTLQLADGTRLPVKGSIVLPLNIDDWQANYKFVIADISDKGILGLDFLEKFNCVINMKQKTVKLEEKVISVQRSNAEKDIHPDEIFTKEVEHCLNEQELSRRDKSEVTVQSKENDQCGKDFSGQQAMDCPAVMRSKEIDQCDEEISDQQTMDCPVGMWSEERDECSKDNVVQQRKDCAVDKLSEDDPCDGDVCSDEMNSLRKSEITMKKKTVYISKNCVIPASSEIIVEGKLANISCSKSDFIVQSSRYCEERCKLRTASCIIAKDKSFVPVRNLNCSRIEIEPRKNTCVETVEEVKDVQTFVEEDRETFVKKIEVSDDLRLHKSLGPKEYPSEIPELLKEIVLKRILKCDSCAAFRRSHRPPEKPPWET